MLPLSVQAAQSRRQESVVDQGKKHIFERIVQRPSVMSKNLYLLQSPEYATAVSAALNMQVREDEPFKARIAD